MEKNRKKPFYKKWWIWVIAIIIIVFAIALGGGDETEELETTEEPMKEVKSVTQEDFEAYASNITGSTFVKTISVTDNKGLIEYYGSYDEFKQAKPESQLTMEDYNSYFETGDKIDKILVSENVRLLRQFPDLTATSMILPYDGKTYSIDLDRQEVNEYLGFKVEELSTSDNSWVEKFVNPIVYVDSERQEFIDTFVKVE